MMSLDNNIVAIIAAYQQATQTIRQLQQGRQLQEVAIWQDGYIVTGHVLIGEADDLLEPEQDAINYFVSRLVGAHMVRKMIPLPETRTYTSNMIQHIYQSLRAFTSDNQIAKGIEKIVSTILASPDMLNNITSVAFVLTTRWYENERKRKPHKSVYLSGIEVISVLENPQMVTEAILLAVSFFDENTKG